MTHPAHMPTPADDRGAETQIEKLFRSFVDSVNGFPHGHESLVRLAIQHAVEATAKDKADLVKALEFYADEQTHYIRVSQCDITGTQIYHVETDIQKDRGKLAREALATLSRSNGGSHAYPVATHTY